MQQTHKDNPKLVFEQIVDNKSPCSLIDFYTGDIQCNAEHYEYDHLTIDDLINGTMSPKAIKELNDEIVMSNECGATLRTIIQRAPFHPNIPNELVYQLLGWSHIRSYKNYTTDEVFPIDTNGWGWEIAKIGAYYILSGGFGA